MKKLNFKSLKELKEFSEYKRDLKKYISLEPLFIAEHQTTNKLMLRLFRNLNNKENKEEDKKIVASIIEKFLTATSELHYLKEEEKNSLFGSKVIALYKSILKYPKLTNAGRKKTIQLTEQELLLIHGPNKK